MKKLLTIFSTLLIMGACSTAPTGQNPSEYLAAAFTDALAQLGSVDGMNAYKYDRSIIVGPLESQSTEMIYLSDNSYKIASACLYNGTRQLSSNQIANFNNEIAYKSAEEGTFTKINDFNLVEEISGKPITDKKGFDTLYTLTASKLTFWRSSKLDGIDRWVQVLLSPSSPSISYFITKESSDNELLIIYVKKSGDNFSVYTNMEEAAKKPIIYKKQ